MFVIYVSVAEQFEMNGCSIDVEFVPKLKTFHLTETILSLMSDMHMEVCM